VAAELAKLREAEVSVLVADVRATFDRLLAR
jgi:hypothetical protein